MYYDPQYTTPTDTSFCLNALTIKFYIDNSEIKLDYTVDYSNSKVYLTSLTGLDTYLSASGTLKMLSKDPRDDTGYAGQTTTFKL